MYAKVGEDKSVYGPILEKAFAKYHGNYEHIIGGNPALAIRTLYGAPYKQLEHKDTAEDALWEALVNADNNNDIIQAGTFGSNDSR